MNTGGPNRPSLVAGSNVAAGTSGGRILADMENRKPEAPAATARRKPLPWILALGCIILVAFLVVLQWPGRLSAPGTGTEFAGDGTLGQPLPGTQASAASPDAVAQPRGAMIIDDPAAEETRNALESLPSSDSATATPEDTRTASTARASRNAPRSASKRTTSRPAKASETDLLSTLMRIIKQGEKDDTAQPTSSMDTLIAQIEAEDNRNRHQNQTALASLGGGNRQEDAVPARSQNVQQQLRACPRANTVAGIECRRRICAQHAGEDVACPRQ